MYLLSDVSQWRTMATEIHPQPWLKREERLEKEEGEFSRRNQLLPLSPQLLERPLPSAVFMMTSRRYVQAAELYTSIFYIHNQIHRPCGPNSWTTLDFRSKHNQDQVFMMLIQHLSKCFCQDHGQIHFMDNFIVGHTQPKMEADFIL